MPKETVYDQSGMYNVQVGWSSSQDVQVGITTADHRAIVDVLARDSAKPDVRAMLDHLTGAGEVASFTGLWGSLDREGCNRLIRILRRARDQAFGRDE